MTKLFLVRHAAVTMDFRIPSAAWCLSEHGVRATRKLVLGASWYGVQNIYHSPELKAVETARIISEMTDIPMKEMDDLRELKVPIINPKKEFIQRVGAYLAGFPDLEFEDWQHATNRIVDMDTRTVECGFFSRLPV